MNPTEKTGLNLIIQQHRIRSIVRVIKLKEATSQFLDATLSRKEFETLAGIVFQYTGITMDERKMPLVGGRLSRRLRILQLRSYSEYIDYLVGDESGEEREIFIDLITTHVTHFFREPEHFVYLGRYIAESKKRPLKIWSAAVSTGEEAYSIALVLQDRLGDSSDLWQILGTDISNESVGRAQTALYPITGADQIPSYYRNRYLLKGKDSMEGYFTFTKNIRSGVKLDTLNLMDFTRLPGGFLPDVVFLRNVMIYFGQQEKEKVLRSVASVMPIGGILMIGHSESLNGLKAPFRLVQTAVYERISDHHDR